MTSPRVFGWIGRILSVDLSSGRIEDLVLSREVYRENLGGRGLTGYFLEAAGVGVWDDPDAPFLIFTGPLAGTGAPSASSTVFAARSPLTGGVGDAVVGGGIGASLKRAGYDGIAITGRAQSWTGLEVSPGGARLVDARRLATMSTSQAAGLLAGKGATVQAGPAAVNGVRFASLLVDGGHQVGGVGLGRALAAKRMLYVTVDGDGPVSVAHPGRFEEASADVERLAAASSLLSGEQGFGALGTVALYDLLHTRRMMPTDNFRRTFFPRAPSLNADAMRRAYGPVSVGCEGCGIRCGKAASSGALLPGVEALSHFTALVGNANLESAVGANVLCRELGMDPVSAAATIACHLEIEGMSLVDGQLEALLRDIAKQEGEGARLAEGSREYARYRGCPDLSMTVKGRELPSYDPRGAYGLALAYAVSTSGGTHLRAYPLGTEILGRPVKTDRFSFAGKARIIKIAEDANAAVDSLVSCRLPTLAVGLEELASLCVAATGLEMTAAELFAVGARICYRERILNHGYGLGGEDDDLPRRFFEEAGSPGPGFETPPIDRGGFMDARRRYYRVRGLDADGAPVEETARSLGLRWNGS